MNTILCIAKNKISIIFLSLTFSLFSLMITISKVVSNNFFPFHSDGIFFFQFNFRYVNELTLNVTFHMNINKGRMKKASRCFAVAAVAVVDVAFEFFMAPKSSIPSSG